MATAATLAQHHVVIKALRCIGCHAIGIPHLGFVAACVVRKRSALPQKHLMVESMFRRFYMIHHDMINSWCVRALIYDTAEVRVHVKSVVPHASIAECLTTPMYSVTLDKIGIDFGNDSVYHVRTRVVNGRHLVMAVSASWMSTSAAQQCQSVVLSHAHTEPTPMVFYVQVGMVMVLLIMGYELIRSFGAQGLTKVMGRQRPTTDSEVQTDEIMDGGDPLHGHAMHGWVWVSAAGKRYHVVTNCRGLNGAITGFIRGWDPCRICAITR